MRIANEMFALPPGFGTRFFTIEFPTRNADTTVVVTGAFPDFPHAHRLRNGGKLNMKDKPEAAISSQLFAMPIDIIEPFFDLYEYSAGRLAAAAMVVSQSRRGFR